MKKLIIGLMVIQVVLILSGVYDVIQGNVLFGVSIILINSIFLALNYSNLRRWYKM